VRYNPRLMQIHLLKSKIHRATVTGGDVNYEGSLTISADLMEKCGLQEYEKILCGNMANGNRWETYVIKGRRGTGEIIMNGAVAHLGKKGDLLTIMNFAAVEKGEAQNWKPQVIVLGPGNKIENTRGKAAEKLPE
jgi:aspartate 1-decarboxylase